MHHFTDIYLPHPDNNATLIWCHGLGATPNDFANLPQCLPKTHATGLSIILPAAPMRPISCNNHMIMPGWYDIPNFTTFLPEDEAGIRQSCQQIHTLIQQQQEKHPSLPIYLGGFSQGGALALFYGTQNPSQIQGIICASGYLPLHQICPAAKKSPPILLLHGNLDPVVPLQLYTLTQQTLANQNYPMTTYTENIEHTISLNGMQHMDHWLTNQIKSSNTQ